MDNSKRGGVRKSLCLLLLLFSCLTSHQSQCAEAAPEDEYAMLLENQGFTGDVTDSRSKLVSSLNHLLEQDEEGKRSSSFFPLRGKKMPSSDPNSEDHYQLMSDHDDKRSQFFPLRGKKIPSELKRASYFMPMRGRKDDDWYSAEEEENDGSLDKRASSFMPMRGKKKSGGALSTFQHFGKPGTYPSVKTEIAFPSSSSSENSRISAKRMSSFIPSRGRKSSQEDFQRLTTAEKSSVPLSEMKNETQPEHSRAKRSISFTPMRGRRLLSDSTAQVQKDSTSDIVTSLLEKKHYSFMPMRGRRTSYFEESNRNLPTIFDSNEANFHTKSSDVSDLQNNADQMSDETSLEENFSNEKRKSSFMPMRGRRDHFQGQYYKSFYPVTTKTSEDKRVSSFLPMRGKRDLYQSSNLDSYFSDTPVPEVKKASSFMPMRGRREKDTSEYSNQLFSEDDKRASSFMPMRGRRDKTDDSSILSALDTSEDLMKRLSFMPMRGRRLSYVLDSDFDRTDKKSVGFMPMRGRRSFAVNKSEDGNDIDTGDNGDKRGYAFMPMRGRRWISENDQPSYSYSAFPYFIPAGIGSALISRPFGSRDMFVSNVRAAATKNRRLYDWDSVKRAFHATRGKRFENEGFADSMEDHTQTEDQTEDRSKSDTDLFKNFRFKRNIFLPQVAFRPQRKYLALKRPMSFFATRGKRMDGSSVDSISKLP